MKYILSIICSLALSIGFTANSFAQEVDKTMTIKVKGITCSTDYKMIQTNVEKLNGVSNVEVGKQGATSTFIVNYNPELVSEEKIYAAIEGTGSCENPDERPYKVKQK